MPSLPVMLNLRGKRCVIVGGGAVAQRRAGALLDAEADVEVIAPQIDPGLSALPLMTHPRPYRAGDLAGAVLVVIASDNTDVNETVHRDAVESGVLVNRVDDPDRGDFIVPAHAHHGPVTLAVHTGGASAAAAASIRRQLSGTLDPDWQVLLMRAGKYRSIIQDTIKDPQQRRGRLLRLADEQAMTILKTQGEDALLEHLRKLTEPDD